MVAATSSLAVALTGAPASAESSATQPTAWLTQTDEHTVLAGVVTRDGSPAGDANVILVAWPDQEALEALADDATVDTRVVAHETTDANGQFAASLDPAVLGQDHTGADGQVDLEVIVADSELEITWNYSAVPAAPETAEQLGYDFLWGNPRIEESTLVTQLQQGMGPTQLTIDLGETATVTEQNNEPQHWLGDDGEPLGDTDAALAASTVPVAPRREGLDQVVPDASVPHAPVGGCGWAALNTYQRNRVERFINSIGTIQGKPWVTQLVGTSHTLGVAFKAAGQNASWTASGEITRSFSAEAVNHRTYTGSVRNRVNYRRYDQTCAFKGKTGAQQWRPHSYHSLNVDHVVISRPSWNKSANCDNVKRNGSFTKEQGANATFSTGVQLSVLSVSAQARYTKNTKIRWDFSGSGAKMCGSNSNGPVSAPQAGAYVP